MLETISQTVNVQRYLQWKQDMLNFGSVTSGALCFKLDSDVRELVEQDLKSDPKPNTFPEDVFNEYDTRHVKRFRKHLNDLLNNHTVTVEDEDGNLFGKPKVKVNTVRNDVSKFRFKKGVEIGKANIVSDNVSHLLGAQYIVTYDVDKRFVRVYIAENEKEGMSAHGTSVYGWSEKKSFRLKVRKPEEQIPELNSKRNLETMMLVMKKWSSKKLPIPTGLFHKEMVLIRIG